MASGLNLPLYGWREIHETGGIVSGDGETEPYEGLPGNPRSFFAEKYPSLVLLDDFGEEGWWNRPFESDEERPARARRVINTLLERHGQTDDSVAIITHGAFYNHLMRLLVGIEGRSVWFSLSNTGITRWAFRKDGLEAGWASRSIDYMNRVDFLPAALVTP